MAGSSAFSAFRMSIGDCSLPTLQAAYSGSRSLQCSTPVAPSQLHGVFHCAREPAGAKQQDKRHPAFSQIAPHFALKCLGQTAESPRPSHGFAAIRSAQMRTVLNPIRNYMGWWPATIRLTSNYGCRTDLRRVCGTHQAGGRDDSCRSIRNDNVLFREWSSCARPVAQSALNAVSASFPVFRHRTLLWTWSACARRSAIIEPPPHPLRLPHGLAPPSHR